MARFGEVLTAMVTPFDDDGHLNVDAAVELARWLADHGSDGLVVAGTTGEVSVLPDSEHLELVQAVTQSVTVPVVAGAGTNDTAHTVELTQRSRSLGIAGVLVVCPYYNRPSQSGLTAHFTAAAEAAGDLPVMIYDIPVRTGRKVDTATLLQLMADNPNIVAVKDAAGSPAESARLIASAPDHVELYCGDDSLTLPLLAVGAVGVVGVATHWVGEEMKEMVRSFKAGDHDRARELNAAMIASYDFESTLEAPNPIPAKAMMRVLGHDVGQCRLPMGDAPPGLDAAAREILAGLEGVTRS